MSSICTNLSTNGASVETSVILSVGERLAVNILIAPEEEPLRMVGQVIWKREIQALDDEARKIHEVGIRFLRPPPSLERREEEAPEIDPYVEEEADGYILPRR
jgi:hypothetical protein